MSNAEHEQSLASAVLAPAHTSQGADGASDITETRTTALSTAQDQLARLSSNSLHRTVSDADRFVGLSCSRWSCWS